MTCTCAFANGPDDCIGDCEACMFAEPAPVLHARDVTVVEGAKLAEARLFGCWMSIEQAARVIAEKRSERR